MTSLHAQVLGDGPDLVFLHGFLGGSDNWRRVAKRWQATYRCTLLDLPNHGQSPVMDPITYIEMADSVAHYCDAHAMTDLTVLGHSMGGKCAIQWANRANHRIQKLIIVDIAPIDYPPHHDLILDTLAGMAGQYYSRLDDIQTLLAKAGLDSMMAMFLTKCFKKGEAGYSLQIPITSLRANYPAIMAQPAIHETIDVPTHVITGADSSYVDEQGRAAYHASFSNVTFHEVPAASHWVHAANPVGFDAILSTLL